MPVVLAWRNDNVDDDRDSSPRPLAPGSRQLVHGWRTDPHPVGCGNHHLLGPSHTGQTACRLAGRGAQQTTPRLLENTEL